MAASKLDQIMAWYGVTSGLIASANAISIPHMVRSLWAFAPDAALTIDAKVASRMLVDPEGAIHTTGSYLRDFNGGGPVIKARSEHGRVDLRLLEDVTLTPVSLESIDSEWNINTGEAGRLVSVNGEYTGGIVDGYQIYLPLNYSADGDQNYPVILSLAGGCYVGGEIADLSNWGIPEQINEMLEHPDELDLEDERNRLLLDTFIVVSPHMIEGSFEDRQFHEQSDAIAEILDEVTANHAVDTDRVYLTGAGRGGHGVWGLASIMPERFAAVNPVRGQRFGIKDYDALGSLPIWVAHCLDDTEVNYGESAAVVRRLEKTGDSFHILDLEEPDTDEYMEYDRLFSSYPGTEWPNLYRGSALFKWFLSRSR